MLSINFVSVLVAAAVNFIIGFMFHGPLFGKLWMKLANITPTGNEKLSQMIPQMVKNFVVNIICAYVLAVFISGIGNYYHNVSNGMSIAFLAWLGFIVTGSSIDVIWMGKSWKLWLFEVISSLVCFLAMGAILAAWY